MEKKFGKGRGDIEDKFGKRDDGDGDKRLKEPRREKKPSSVVASMGEPLIVVNVNDRLGTKASIPCLASDPISMSHTHRLSLHCIHLRVPLPLP